jgi:hypothetical protein
MSLILCSIALLGCDRRGATQTNMVSGVAVSSATVRTGMPSPHGSAEEGEVWVKSSGLRFEELRGRPPYFVTVAESPYIVLERDRDSKRELIVADVKLGKYFALPDLYAGISDGARGELQDGMVVLVTADPDGILTIRIDPVAKKLLSNEYKKTGKK